MIYANKVLQSYIEAQKDKASLAKELEITKQTLYNMLNGEDVSAETIAKVLNYTGFEFDKVFEVRE